MSFKKYARDFLSAAFRAGISAADPESAVVEHLQIDGDQICFNGEKTSLSAIDKIWVVGFGKAAANMARGVESVLGERIHDGIVVTKYGHGASLDKIKVLEAGHPVPDSAGVVATSKIIDMVQRAGPDDLVIFLVSGGGSALLVQPREGISLDDKQTITGLLLRKAVPIEQMNVVRKVLSKVKGGQLALLAEPARLVSFVISDVIGDPLGAIASGPTAPAKATIDEAIGILHKAGVWDEMPGLLRQWFEESGNRHEASSNDFSGITNIIIANNHKSLCAIDRYAAAKNYETLLLSGYVQGEAREVARVYGAIAREIRENGRPIRAPACVIAGGETTVNVVGSGLGGRNTEMVLAILPDIAGLADVAFLSAGTDGSDGPTDAAGAFAFSDSLERASARGLDAVQYLQQGPTGTNVMDIQILLVN
jgi:hydroxypyruvate reductase